MCGLPFVLSAMNRFE